MRNGTKLFMSIFTQAISRKYFLNDEGLHKIKKLKAYVVDIFWESHKIWKNSPS